MKYSISHNKHGTSKILDGNVIDYGNINKDDTVGIMLAIKMLLNFELEILMHN